MSRRWESQRRDGISTARMLGSLLTVIVLPVTIWALAQITHGWALIAGAALVLGAYLWLFRDRNDSDYDDEDGAV